MTSPSRARWEVVAPQGGWSPPWTQVAELAHAIPTNKWTLVGGLMVELHAAHAGMRSVRSTIDVDMILHIDSGATTFVEVRDGLEYLGYELQRPVGGGPIHRFLRLKEQIDVMVADHLDPKLIPRAAGRPVFAIPAGTSALRKTVDAHVTVNGDEIRLSVPDVLGALVLKGAAYVEDTRDRERHLEDAAILSCAITDPGGDLKRMVGSDRGRVRRLAEALADPEHTAWRQLPAANRMRGQYALRRVTQDP